MTIVNMPFQGETLLGKNLHKDVIGIFLWEAQKAIIDLWVKRDTRPEIAFQRKREFFCDFPLVCLDVISHQGSSI